MDRARLISSEPDTCQNLDVLHPASFSELAVTSESSKSLLLFTCYHDHTKVMGSQQESGSRRSEPAADNRRFHVQSSPRSLILHSHIY